jgi:6-phosphogluconate dehydrogenase
MQGGHVPVVYDIDAATRAELGAEGATPAESLEAMVGTLTAPRTVWVMLPAGKVTEGTIAHLASILGIGDTIIDGGNTYYKDDVRRAAELQKSGIHYIDVGTSGGVWGLTRGYCMMIGGPDSEVRRLDPIFRTLAPGIGDIPRTPDRHSHDPQARAAADQEEGAGPFLDPRAEMGYIHAGPAGAGHFVKMVHNGIEYGMMQAYGEGFNILQGKNADLLPPGERYDLKLADIAEVWRRGSVVSSWLLDLAAEALAKDPALESFSGYVEDSGEGRWTVEAAIEEAVPAEVLTASLYTRFRSRQSHNFAEKLLSAMRFGFGGHLEKKG